MPRQPPVNIDAAATAKELGYLALIGVESELTRAENLRKTDMEREARLTGTYSPDLSYSGEGGGMPGMPAPGGVRGYGGGYGGERELRPTLRPGTMPGGETDAAYNDPSLLDPKHYRVDYLRRRIRQNLYGVQLGLVRGDDN